MGAVVGAAIGAAAGAVASVYAAEWLSEAASAQPEKTIDDPGSLAGATAEEVGKLVPKGWVEQPTREGEGTGTRWLNPDKPGEAVRVMPGKATDANPVMRGPYVRVSKDGSVSDPIPLKGNPTLNNPR